MFSFMRSKKTSETGVWENDEEVHDCPLCEVHFTVLIRKHHCRQCGRVVCRNCASNFKFLESSRSGTEKRICDECFGQDRKAARDDDSDDDRDTARVSKAMAAVKVSSGGGGGGSGARATSSSEVQGRPPPASVNEVPQAEAIEALKAAKWTGKWKFALNFHSVDMGSKPMGVDAAASSFKKLSASTAVKAGSKMSIVLDLKPKGAAYFQGECPEFAQFGKEGKVTGALQRSLGRVNMTLQIVSAVTKVTTSFNFVGAVSGARTRRRSASHTPDRAPPHHHRRSTPRASSAAPSVAARSPSLRARQAACLPQRRRTPRVARRRGRGRRRRRRRPSPPPSSPRARRPPSPRSRQKSRRRTPTVIEYDRAT